MNYVLALLMPIFDSGGLQIRRNGMMSNSQSLRFIPTCVLIEQSVYS